MNIKAVACTVLCVLMCTLSGSGVYEQYPVVRYHYEVSRDLSVYFTNSDEVIERIREALVARQHEITIEYASKSDNMQDIEALVGELMDFALSETDRPYEGDYLDCSLDGYEISYRYDETGGKYSYSLVITPVYYTDASQEIKVTAVCSELTRGLDTKSEYDRVRAVYDYICKNVRYDEIHLKNEHYYLRSAAYGALINKRATCQGYAAAVYRLMREAGIGCRVIKGRTYNEYTDKWEYHAWNIVCIDGLWYYLDATRDAGKDEYGFFLKGSAAFRQHLAEEKYLRNEFVGRYPVSEGDYSISR